MANNDTWFDAFFQAVTSSQEFKAVVENDWGEDMEKAIKKMDSAIEKASTIPQKLKKQFDTKEAKEVWQSMHSFQPQSEMKTDKKDQETTLDIYYPEVKNPDTFGFLWVAWMDDLKETLKQDFIKPLQFKFMVEKLEWESKNETDKKVKDEKTKLYSKIYEVYKQFKVSIPIGMLFYGPPGTWKTFITKKLAEELWAGLIKKSVWEFGSSYMHQTSKNIKDFFEWAKKASEKWPIILFLDEIDSLVSKRTNNIDANKAEEVSQFLQEFNNLSEAKNLIVIAATNRPDHLDSAILRSGRFDKKIYIWAPDFEARKELFKMYIEKVKRPHKMLDYETLATLTEGYVAADIEAICDDVSRDASKTILEIWHSLSDKNINLSEIASKLDNHFITMELLKQSIIGTVSSLKMVDMSIYDDWKNSLK